MYLHILQLLAALLITRQVVGNIKESIIPYAKKHFKLAQLSFDRYGALSPTENRQNLLGDDGGTPSGNDEEVLDKKDEDCDMDTTSTSRNGSGISPRSFSQVECESSAPPVCYKKTTKYIITNNQNINRTNSTLYYFL